MDPRLGNGGEEKVEMRLWAVATHCCFPAVGRKRLKLEDLEKRMVDLQKVTL